MTRQSGTVEVSVSVRMSDVVKLIARRYGSMAKLRKHIDTHPKDKAALMLWDTVRRHGDEPDLVVQFGEMLIGDPAEILGQPRLELMAVLMGWPGLSVRALARKLGKNPATVLAQVDALEEAGLVLKEPGGPGKPASIRPLATELTIRVSAEA